MVIKEIMFCIKCIEVKQAIDNTFKDLCKTNAVVHGIMFERSAIINITERAALYTVNMTYRRLSLTNKKEFVPDKD